MSGSEGVLGFAHMREGATEHTRSWTGDDKLCCELVSVHEGQCGVREAARHLSLAVTRTERDSNTHALHGPSYS